MTREEAIIFLNTDDYESKGYNDAVGMAIKALKQMDVLDQIRAEIEEYSLLTRERVIGIIDKYRKVEE